MGANTSNILSALVHTLPRQFSGKLIMHKNIAHVFFDTLIVRLKKEKQVPSLLISIIWIQNKHIFSPKGWVLAKSPLQDVHVPEECSTIDKIAEVITIYKDQAEKSNMHPMTQCHTPYVGPSTELWAPCQTFDTCSVTSIPCEDFSLFFEALPDKADNLMQSLTTACFTEDELSSKACSLKSLESLGNGGPSEAPVIFFPTSLCFKQDYCTLMDTPTGPVPTFTGDVELNGDLFSD